MFRLAQEIAPDFYDVLTPYEPGELQRPNDRVEEPQEDHKKNRQKHKNILIQYGNIIRAFKRADKRYRDSDKLSLAESIEETEDVVSVNQTSLQYARGDLCDLVYKEVSNEDALPTPLYVVVRDENVRLTMSDYRRLVKQEIERRN